MSAKKIAPSALRGSRRNCVDERAFPVIPIWGCGRLGDGEPVVRHHSWPIAISDTQLMTKWQSSLTQSFAPAEGQALAEEYRKESTKMQASRSPKPHHHGRATAQSSFLT
jgi:hypothetical protein